MIVVWYDALEDASVRPTSYFRSPCSVSNVWGGKGGTGIN